MTDPSPPTPSPSPGPEPTPPPPQESARGGVAAWALTFAIAALCASLFMGWALPVGLTGVVLAIIAVARRSGPTSASIWALVLGAVSILYSAGWLMWAAGRTGVVG